jgi:hypothetical protein
MSANKASFTCPIFNVETRVSHCLQLRDKVWAGFKPPIRKGCQACMTAGKCPMAKMVDKIIYGKQGKDAPEPYASAEPKQVKLRDDLLERVLPVLVRHETMSRYDVSDKERELIESANDRIRKQMQNAPLASSDTVSTPYRRSAPKKVAPKPSNTNNRINEAAASGDLAAAVNAA